MRDRIRAVERVLERQKITNIRQGDIDVIGFAREQDEACVQVFSIRGGHLLGRENFILEHVSDEEDRDVIRDFLQQFYGRSMQIPQALSCRLAFAALNCCARGCGSGAAAV